MSSGALAWAVADVFLAVIAGTVLLRASSRPQVSVRNGYRWLAVAALCLGAGAAVQHASDGLIGGSQPLRVADLMGLAAVPAIVIGIATLTSGFAAGDVEQAPVGVLSRAAGRASGRREAAGQVSRAWVADGRVPGIVIDSGLLVASLFVICLVTMYGPAYTGAGLGPAAFAVYLIRPVADLVALGLLLRFVVRSARLALLPAIALAAVALADSLAVASRVNDNASSLATNLILLVGLGLLAVSPPETLGATLRRSEAQSQAPGGQQAGSAAAQRPSRRPAGSWSSPATLAALAAAAVAALVVTGFSIGGGPLTAPAVAVSSALVVLLLVIRLAGLARQASVAAASAGESDRLFRTLADATLDAVIVCDLAGIIEYASPAVADYGYAPDQLLGTRLIDLVHPEDRPASMRAAIAALNADPETGPDSAAPFAGRVRGADGSWHHIECSLSRYGQPTEPPRLLVTARDVSDRVALLREVEHLTFHDGLTGLPNRAYIEERLRDLTELAPGGVDQRGERLASTAFDGGGAIGAVMVQLDGFAAVSELVGPSGGDLVLAQAGRRLRALAPPDATVARWGADEFAILIAEAASGQEVIELAERVLGEIIAEPFDVTGQELALTVSVGVATSGAAEGGATELPTYALLTNALPTNALLTNAHLAMSWAAEAGGARVQGFDAAMHSPAARASFAAQADPACGQAG